MSNAVPMVADARGAGLRKIREEIGLTLRQVEHRSRNIAWLNDNPHYIVSSARLSQVESNGSLPSVYKLASLSRIYHMSIADLLQIYGIDTESQN